jgi:hypothetical protein
MKKLLTLMAVAETATGVALMVVPPLVGRLFSPAEALRSSGGASAVGMAERRETTRKAMTE